MNETQKFRKKLIEVALPLESINIEALKRKQKAPKGYPTSFHKWWAQRPIAACRAVLFASMVDDPSEHPEEFPTLEAQSVERERLLDFIRTLITWENSQDDQVLEQAWREISRYMTGEPPIMYDPFAGGGSIPLEAQRLGLQTFASDLNPVAVIINKAMIEITAKFNDCEPINPDWTELPPQKKDMRSWRGAQGLAEDVRYYGAWLRKEAQERLSYLYPDAFISPELATTRPDLKPYVGKTLKVIAWLWARTVKSPNPAFSSISVPLATTFLLSTKPGREAYVEPIIEDGGYRFEVRLGKPSNPSAINDGTKLSRGAHFNCVMSNAPIASEYIYSEANAKRMGITLMSVVVEGDRGRLYLSPTDELSSSALKAKPDWSPDIEMPQNPRWFSPPLYGLKTFGDLFTSRQLVGLTTFADLIPIVRNKILSDVVSRGAADDGISLEEGGSGATAYADSLAIYLACAVDRMVYYGSSITTWLTKDNALRDCMPRQALAMSWDFAECNPLAKSSGDITTCINSVANYLDFASPRADAKVFQKNAATEENSTQKFLFSTDPPYYDNIGYADLSDYFYVWLRRSLRGVLPSLLRTLEVPKSEELVASAYRHGGEKAAEIFFMEGMSAAMAELARRADDRYPVTIYYAFKQAETDSEEGVSSSGWETFLEAVIRAGFAINGTWPVRTEGAGRMLAKGTNALGSSIVLVCRPRMVGARTATRREFLEGLRAELPTALAHLQKGNILPVDLAQAAIGPGMAVYTRYGNVIDADGNHVSVGQAFTMINRVLDELLAEQDGDFDGETRWALTWFEQFGFTEANYDTAETLSKAKNTSVSGMLEAGILSSKGGRVRLLEPKELPVDWNPQQDSRLTLWESVHQMIRALAIGEAEVARLVSQLGVHAETSLELVYRLDNICKQQGRTQERLAYNALVQSWPEITRLARHTVPSVEIQVQSDLFSEKV